MTGKQLQKPSLGTRDIPFRTTRKILSFFSNMPGSQGHVVETPKHGNTEQTTLGIGGCRGATTFHPDGLAPPKQRFSYLCHQGPGPTCARSPDGGAEIPNAAQVPGLGSTTGERARGVARRTRARAGRSGARELPWQPSREPRCGGGGDSGAWSGGGGRGDSELIVVSETPGSRDPFWTRYVIKKGARARSMFVLQ